MAKEIKKNDGGSANADTALAKLPAELQALYETRSNDDIQLDNEDRIIPSLDLMQALSPEVSDGKAQAGEIRNRTDQFLYAEKGEAFEFIPLFAWKSRIRWIPRDEGDGIRCRADDGKRGVGDPGGPCDQCILSTWGDDGSPPECTAGFNVMIFVPGVDASHHLVILRGQKTQYKPLKNWLNMSRMLDGRIFTWQHRLAAFMDQNKKGDKFWNWKFPAYEDGKSAHRVADAETLKRAYDYYQMMTQAHSSGALKTDIDDAGEPAQQSEFGEAPF